MWAVGARELTTIWSVFWGCRCTLVTLCSLPLDICGGLRHKKLGFGDSPRHRQQHASAIRDSVNSNTVAPVYKAAISAAKGQHSRDSSLSARQGMTKNAGSRMWSALEDGDAVAALRVPHPHCRVAGCADDLHTQW